METELSNKINELLKARNISVRKLALDIDIPYTTLRSILLGDTNDMKLSIAKKICKYFNITLDQLAGDKSIDLDSIKFANISNNSINTNNLSINDIEELQRIADYMKNRNK